MFLLVPAHPGFPGQIPQSRKTVVCVCVHSNVPLSQQTVDRIMPKFIFDKNYSVFIPVRKDWTYDEVVLNDDVICYTDGSRFEHIGTSGAGIYNHTDNEEVLPLGHNTSVFQAEVYVIAQCAKMENLLHRNNSCIAICSDSLSAIKAVSAAKVTTGTVADAMQALKALAIYNSVRLVWVPGHCGVEGNDRADLPAKEAASTPFIGPEPSLGLAPLLYVAHYTIGLIKNRLDSGKHSQAVDKQSYF